jgi:hypothetical protein
VRLFSEEDEIIDEGIIDDEITLTMKPIAGMVTKSALKKPLLEVISEMDELLST